MKHQIEKYIDDVITVINDGYQILLESDLVALLFHFMIQDPQIGYNLHMNTRLSQALNDKEKIDIVFGDVEVVNTRRPSVIPKLLIEAKAMPFGFTMSQKIRRKKEIKKDIAKVAKYKLDIPRYIIVYDCEDFLDQQKIDELTNERNRQDPGINIYLISRIFGKWSRREY